MEFEKVEEPEEPEEELYDYISEEEEEEEEEFVSKSKKSSSKQSSDRNKKPTTLAASSVNRSRNLTRDKTSSYNDEDVNPEAAKQDIRTAFFRASATAKPKTEKRLDDGVASVEDDLANEIMQELTNKKPAPPKPAVRPKPINLTPGRPQPFGIPFASNSPHISNTVLSLSPAHKRKLSPSKPQAGDQQPQLSKKIDLDDDLVNQLFDSDSNHGAADNSSAATVVKSEPMCYEPPVVVKAEKIDFADGEDEDDLALLSGLSLDGNCSNLTKHLNLPIKQESNLSSSGMELTLNNTNITMNDEIDFSAQIKNMDSSNKMLMYWYDLFEDQFNSNGTVYLFGKMPLTTKQNAANETETQTADNDKQQQQQQLSFVSVCCIVKNIPKVIYVLPRKYKKSKVKREPGVPEQQRELVAMDDVRKDVDALMEKNKIFSYRVKTVKKCFPFDKQRKNNTASVIDPDDEVPFESEYLQVEFQPDKHSILNQLDAAEGECFSTVFNANASHSEQLLIDLKLKGNLFLILKIGSKT